MSSAVSVTGILAAFVAGNGVSRLRMTGRLRESIAAEQLILEKLGRGSEAHTKLAAHLDHRVQLLVAEQMPYTADERRGRRWGTGLVAWGITALTMTPVLLFAYAPIDTGWAAAVVILGLGLGLGALLLGVHLIMEPLEKRSMRRDDARKRLDRSA